MIRFNYRILPLLTVLFLISLAFGGNLPFYMFYSLAFLLLLSYSYMRLIKATYKMEVSCSSNIITAGEEVSVITRVVFNMILPIPYVEIRSGDFLKSGDKYSGFVRNTKWNENIWIETEISFPTRGYHTLEPVSIRVTDLFHLMYLESTYEPNISIKVYPKIYKLNKLTIGGVDIYKNSKEIRSRNEDPHTIRDVRKYREGDSIKRIHWKLSAKQEDLYVKNFDRISGEEAILFIDMHKSNFQHDSSGIIEEYITDFSVSIVKQVVERNLSIKVFLNNASGRYFEIDDKQGFDNLMDYLLEQKSDGNTELYTYIYENTYRLHRMNQIIIVTAEINGELAAALMNMGSTGYSVYVFYCSDKPLQEDYVSMLKSAQVQCVYFRDFIENKRM